MSNKDMPVRSRIRAKSEIKLITESGFSTTWTFPKGQPLVQTISDLIRHSCSAEEALAITDLCVAITESLRAKSIDVAALAELEGRG